MQFLNTQIIINRNSAKHKQKDGPLRYMADCISYRFFKNLKITLDLKSASGFMLEAVYMEVLL